MRTKKLLTGIGSWVIGGAVLVVVLAYLAGLFTPKVGTEPVAAPQTEVPAFTGEATVTEAEEPVVERAPGTLSAVREASISARIMAAIGQITVRAGDKVSANQLLVELDSRDLSARQAQSRESVAAARARLQDAEKEYNRLKSLVAEGVIARSQFDTAEANFTAAKADVARAEQAVTETSAGASYASITAPFAGRVVDRYAEPGDMASPGQPLLKIYDPSRMRIEAYVRESLAASLKPGQPLKVQIDALQTEVEGQVQEIVPQAEPGSRSVLVKVGLPAREDLFPGMFGRVLIPEGTTRRIYVPQAAIHRIGQLTYVWVLGEGKTPARRFVTLGEHVSSDRIEVLSGLEAGERVGLASQI